MHILKSVGVMSVAKIMGFLYACMGLIFVPFFLIVGLAGSVAGQKENPFAPFAGIFGIMMAVLMPILYGVMGCHEESFGLYMQVRSLTRAFPA